MLNALGSRMTYANVMATVAVFLALGGGAYALSGIPDRGGVYHGCVSNRSGLLRVVKTASSCRTTHITTPPPGSVFVLSSIRAGISCGASGSCLATWGVYLDGSPVPFSAQKLTAQMSTNASDDLTLAGIVSNVPAGAHTITI